eukprot:PhM_4_TR3409/c1_g1_i3/m.29750
MAENVFRVRDNYFSALLIDHITFQNITMETAPGRQSSFAVMAIWGNEVSGKLNITDISASNIVTSTGGFIQFGDSSTVGVVPTISRIRITNGTLVSAFESGATYISRAIILVSFLSFTETPNKVILESITMHDLVAPKTVSPGVKAAPFDVIRIERYARRADIVIAKDLTITNITSCRTVIRLLETNKDVNSTLSFELSNATLENVLCHDSLVKFGSGSQLTARNILIKLNSTSSPSRQNTEASIVFDMRGGEVGSTAASLVRFSLRNITFSVTDGTQPKQFAFLRTNLSIGEVEDLTMTTPNSQVAVLNNSQIVMRRIFATRASTASSKSSCFDVSEGTFLTIEDSA